MEVNLESESRPQVSCEPRPVLAHYLNCKELHSQLAHRLRGSLTTLDPYRLPPGPDIRRIVRHLALEIRRPFLKEALHPFIIIFTSKQAKNDLRV